MIISQRRIDLANRIARSKKVIQDSKDRQHEIQLLTKQTYLNVAQLRIQKENKLNATRAKA